MNSILPSFRSVLMASVLACVTTLPLSAAPRHAGKAAEEAPVTNDFPTQARVEYVMQCMAEHGGTNLDNMYHCVCAVDKIASRMKYQDYSESLTFTYMYDTPGDKGGEFRDPPRSRELRDLLKDARQDAQSCFPSQTSGSLNK